MYFMNEKQQVKELVNVIFDAIDEKKGNNIIIIKFSPELTTICEYFIIADAESERQLKAIMENIEMKVKEAFKLKPLHIEGTQTAQWIVLDYLDVIVHLFLPEAREFYALEKLWADAQFFNSRLN
jgi:ribosome-associated protein